MSPKEKFEQLDKEYSCIYIVEVARNMILYYIGTGQKELRQFWSEVEYIANINIT